MEPKKREGPLVGLTINTHDNFNRALLVVGLFVFAGMILLFKVIAATLLGGAVGFGLGVRWHRWRMNKRLKAKG